MDNTEHNDETKDTEPKSAPLMDVQPPRSVQDTPAADDMPSLTDEGDAAIPPKPEVVTPSTVNEVAPAPDPAPDPSPNPPEPADDSKPNLSIPELPAHTKKKPPVLAIVLLIILALGLAAGAVYLFTETEDSAKDTQTQNNSAENTTPAESTITPAEVDETIKQTEDAVNGLDDTQDFNADELSDSALGL